MSLYHHDSSAYAMTEPKPTMHLSELLGHVRTTIQNSYRSSYWIVAEVTSISSSGGHYYFELAELQQGRVVAKCRANMWSSVATRVLLRFAQVTGGYPRAGMELMLLVGIDFHVQYGFALHIRDINPEHTLGELERRKQETIQRLKEEGLYDLNRQHNMPALLQRLAVISSETAAGWGDFQDQMSKGAVGGLFRIDLYPALMQGEGTTRSVHQALQQILSRSTEYDAIVLLRGGGSRMDLAAFDDYHLALLIARSPLPFITAIGHERDVSVADMVAHTTLKTPTAAAEYLLRRMEGELIRSMSAEQRLSQLLTQMVTRVEQRSIAHTQRMGLVLTTHERAESRRLHQYVHSCTLLLSHHRSVVSRSVEPLQHRFRALLEQLPSSMMSTQMQLQHRITQLVVATQRLPQREGLTMDRQIDRLRLLLQRQSTSVAQRVEQAAHHLSLVDPTRIMRRGYVPVVGSDGSAIRSLADLHAGDAVRIILPEGEASAKVQSVTSHDLSMERESK